MPIIYVMTICSLRISSDASPPVERGPLPPVHGAVHLTRTTYSHPDGNLKGLVPEDRQLEVLRLRACRNRSMLARGSEACEAWTSFPSHSLTHSSPAASRKNNRTVTGKRLGPPSEAQIIFCRSSTSAANLPSMCISCGTSRGVTIPTSCSKPDGATPIRTSPHFQASFTS